MAILGMILLGIGFIIALVFGIQLLIIAFQESVLWGLIYLLVPLGNIAFIIMNWEDCKSPFLKSLIGIPFMIVGMMMMPAQEMGMM